MMVQIRHLLLSIDQNSYVYISWSCSSTIALLNVSASDCFDALIIITTGKSSPNLLKLVGTSIFHKS